jgi:hypothetical protein
MNIGVREQLIFPEIEYDKVDKIRGMDIAIVTTARSDEEARELLRGLGLPFREGGAAESAGVTLAAGPDGRGDGQARGAARRRAAAPRPQAAVDGDAKPVGGA